MKNNKDLLAIAKKQIGKGGATFRKYCGLANGAPWCNAFIFWLFDAHEDGNLFPVKGSARTYCPASIKWCKENLAEIPPYIAMACDIIYFDWEMNGTPNHIGIVECRKSTKTIRTIEGNTSGGKVDDKNRSVKYVQGIYRPHFKPDFKIKKLKIDGVFGYNTIANLQKALGGCTVDGILGRKTVIRLQKYLAIKQDGAWGVQTSKAVQKLTGAKVDGEFGVNSVKSLQRWINKQNDVPEEHTNVDKLIDKMKFLAWAYGTPKAKWKYKTGAPKDVCKKAMSKYGYKTKERWSDCGDFVTTVVRESGIDKSFKALAGVSKPFPKSDKFTTVWKGKRIPDGFLKAGDIIRYKKKKGQHAMFYFGDGKVCDAGHYSRFGNIRKDEKRYSRDNVKFGTMEVLRVKE